MTTDDTDDIDQFLHGLVFFLRMTAEQMMEWVKTHPNESLSQFQLRHFSGQGSAFCTSEGISHLASLVGRKAKALPNARDLDPDEVFREVAQSVCPSLKAGAEKGEDEHTTVEQVVKAALDSVLTGLKPRTYHFPCVLAGAKKSEEFSIGPVTFKEISRFEAWLVSLDPAEAEFSEAVRSQEFIRYVRQFGWIASVQVPPCSSKISESRAELAVRTAINIVRVWFGLGHGSRMRLVHLEPATSGFSKYLVEESNKVSMSWSRTWEGASVADGWLDQVDQEHHKLVSWILRDIVFDERTEVADRIIDALSWFGDAAFEPSPGAKLTKLVMLLERLTITRQRFSKKRFCARVAILAMDDDSDFEAKYWAAYDFYNARSSISHGAISQSAEEHWAALRDAQRLITNTLFRGIELYGLNRFARTGKGTSLAVLLTSKRTDGPL